MARRVTTTVYWTHALKQMDNVGIDVEDLAATPESMGL
jgi:hypothetical protein